MNSLERHKAKARDLTTGSPAKKILLFGLPLIFSNVLQVLFNMSDIAVVGHFAENGSAALGSVGSTSIYVMLFTGMIIGLGSGVNAIAARHLGSANDDGVSRITHTAFLVSLIFGVVLSALGMAVARPVLGLLGTKPELLEDAVKYVYIYFAGLPGLAFYNFGNGVLSADGDTARPLIFLAVAGAINVLLNLFFVIVCKMSVAGVATASVVSQYISAILIIIALLRTDRPYKIRFRSLKINGAAAKTLLAMGIPAGLQNAIFSVANLFIQSAVNTFDTVMVEGNSAASNSDALVYDVMAAFYVACSSFIAQNYGAGKRKNILKCYFICLGYSFGIGLILGLLLVFCGRAFLSLFTSDEAIIEAGMKRLNIMGFSYAVSAFMDCTIAASRGLGKTLVSTIIVIMGSCVFRVIWVFTVFAHFQTIPSLYLLYIFSWSITALAEIGYFIYVYRSTAPKKEEEAPKEGETVAPPSD